LNDSLAEMSHLNDEAARRPTDADIRVKIAHLCEQLGKFDLPMSWYRAALASAPGNPAARSGLATLRIR
jgi:Flp pilus assembly protein TadD